MKICAIICEFNPFHNGHKYLLEQAKAVTSCDAVVCIMSGNFTQRGELCIFDKYTKAKHAVMGGADCILELPVAFAVAPAEIFASGAIKILASIPEITHVAFGCEDSDKEIFLNAAKILLNENTTFSEILNKELKVGESYIKSYKKAFSAIGGNEKLISKPNNILALEYTKSIIKLKSNIEIVPVKRSGADYNDAVMHENFSSASAIRANLNSELTKKNVPDFVFNDLNSAVADDKKYKDFLKLVLSRTSPEDLRQVYGASEGLENKILSLSQESFDTIIEECTSRRYSSSRIKRILCENFLKLYKNECEEFFINKLYIKPLAVKALTADKIFGALAKSDYPIILKGRDREKLDNSALKCIEKDDFADKQWQQITEIKFENKLITV